MATVNVPEGVAKKWVNFNGTGTIAIRDHEGVSSLTDNGTGDYTVNYSGNMADANHSVNVNANSVGSGLWSGVVSIAVGSVRLQVRGTGTTVDVTYVFAQAWGALA